MVPAGRAGANDHVRRLPNGWITEPGLPLVAPFNDVYVGRVPAKWRNGRRARLKIEYRKVCGFKSLLGHYAANSLLFERFLAVAGRRE